MAHYRVPLASDVALMLLLSDPLFLHFTAVILAKVCKLKFASGRPVQAHPVVLKFKPSTVRVKFEIFHACSSKF